ncbi:receptor-type tyrosine-protein phosphatase kappa-like, partial [Argonauta hians]
VLCTFLSLYLYILYRRSRLTVKKPSLLLKMKEVIVYLLLQCCCWHQVAVKWCPTGKFGTNCSLTCHCINGDIACNAVNGCNDSLCEQGYRNAPACQTRCAPGSFGQSCLFLCHCPEKDTCSPVNGNCFTGRCHRNWYGTGCQTQLSTLVNPPTVKVLDCHTVSVTWRAWNYSLDRGSTPVAAYSLKMSSKSETNWVDKETIVQIKNHSVYTVNVTGLKENHLYQFRVDVLSSSKDINIRGPKGVPTPFIFIPCSDLSDKTLWSINTTDGGGIEIFLHMKYKSIVKASYEETGIGDCSDVSANVSRILFESNYLLLNTSLWRRYTVTIDIMSPYNLHYVESILTAETVPSGIIQNVRKISLSASSVTIEWDDLLCTDRGGVLVQYEISLKTYTTAIATTTTITTLNQPIMKTLYRFFVIPDLKPFTKYGVRIRYVNSKGSSAFSKELTFQTLQTVPSAPLLDNITTTATTATLTWRPGTQSNGILNMYMARCIQTTDPTQVKDQVEPVSTLTNVTFTGLQPYTNYSVKIKASTDIGWGNFSNTLTALTKEDIPSPVLKVSANYQNKCIAISWNSPEKPNGNIVSYKLVTTELFSYQHINQKPLQSSLVLGDVMSYEHCTVRPATLYSVKVAASTSAGTGKTGVAVSCWTEIETPPPPPQPVLNNVSDTTIEIILRPTTIFTGPVSWYNVRVRKLSSVEKCYNDIDVNKESNMTIGALVAKLTPKDLNDPTNFSVGDGKTYGGLFNPPLVNNSCYEILYELCSSLNNVTKFNFSQINAVTSHPSPVAINETHVNILAIVAVILVLVVLILAVLLFTYLRMRKSSKKPAGDIFTINNEDCVLPADSNHLEKHWTSISSLNERRRLVMYDDLPNSSLYRDDKVGNLNKDERNKISHCLSFCEEYDALTSYCTETCPDISHFQEASKRENSYLNRFPQKLPYDNSRVVLTPDISSDNTYINASHVTYKRPGQCKYIAAQSPFNKETVRDFWRLIYQQKVKVVVMLTKHMEENVLKCSKYFPQVTGEQFRFEIFNMKLIYVQTYADYSISTINFSLENETIERVIIFEFFSWPECITSQNAIPLLGMHQKVCQASSESSSPILIHCGTGINRSGTYIIIDILLKEFGQKKSINLFSAIKDTRMSINFTLRPYSYLLFVYEAVFEMYQDRNDQCLTYDNISIKYREQFLQNQFKNLCRFTPKINNDQLTAGRLQVNKSKNRFLAILPPENFRVILHSAKNAYINAVFLDGYSRKKQYILTQTPMTETVGDFWHLIYEYNVRTIIMMDKNIKKDTCASYWKKPAGSKTLWISEYFEVVHGNRVVDDDSVLEQLEMKVTKYRKEHTRKIHLYRYKNWEGSNFVPICRDYMLYLIHQKAEWQRLIKHKPIVVHCKDGATNSGLFCVADNLIEQMSRDRSVDIYHTVKNMKRRRPEMIQDVKQYRFLYSLLDLYNRFLTEKINVRIIPTPTGLQSAKGRVEVFYNNIWGTICDDNFDSTNAYVVCKSLNYESGKVLPAGSYPEGSGRIWMDDVRCVGNEKSIFDCQYSPLGSHDCTHKQDVMLSCTTSLNTQVTQCDNSSSEIRLNGNIKGTGLVEVLIDGSWGSICDDYWDLNDAKVACRQLCYDVKYALPSINSQYYPPPRYPIKIGKLNCRGTEAKITDCPYDSNKVTNCVQSEASSVSCIQQRDTLPTELQTSMTCSPSDMTIIIFKDTTSSISPDTLSFTKTCDNETTLNDTYISIKFSLGDCGSQSQVINTTHLLFSLTVIHTPITKGDIVRSNTIKMTFECVYKRTNSVIQNPWFVQTVAVTEKSTGNFIFRLNFYRDSSFANVVNTFPIKVSLSTWLNVAIVLDTSNSNLKLVVPSCWVTTSPDKNSSPRYQLFQNKCTVDRTLSFSPINQTMFGFRFQTFRFLNSEKPLYLHCTVLVCNTATKSAECDRTCSFKNGRRKKRQTNKLADGVSYKEQIISSAFILSENLDKSNRVSKLPISTISTSGDPITYFNPEIFTTSDTVLTKYSSISQITTKSPPKQTKESLKDTSTIIDIHTEILVNENQQTTSEKSIVNTSGNSSTGFLNGEDNMTQVVNSSLTKNKPKTAKYVSSSAAPYAATNVFFILLTIIRCQM